MFTGKKIINMSKLTSYNVAVHLNWFLKASFLHKLDIADV